MPNTASLKAFLGDNPMAVFQSAISGMSPQMRKFWEYKYGNIFNQYMGQQAKQAQQGAMPTGNFGEFLKPYNWLQEYAGYTPYQRGFRPSTYTPAVRKLSY